MPENLTVGLEVMGLILRAGLIPGVCKWPEPDLAVPSPVRMWIFFSVLNWFMYFYTKYIDTEIKCVFHSLAYVYSRGLLPLMVPKYLINFEILLLNFILQWCYLSEDAYTACSMWICNWQDSDCVWDEWAWNWELWENLQRDW